MIDFDSHRRAALMEDLKFLRESGMSDEAIARRLNLKKDTLHRKEDRHGAKPSTESPRGSSQS